MEYTGVYILPFTLTMGVGEGISGPESLGRAEDLAPVFLPVPESYLRLGHPIVSKLSLFMPIESDMPVRLKQCQGVRGVEDTRSGWGSQFRNTGVISPLLFQCPSLSEGAGTLLPEAFLLQGPRV